MNLSSALARSAASARAYRRALLLLIAALLAGASAPAQTRGYTVASISPTAAPAGNPGMPLTVVVNDSGANPNFQICFYTGYGSSATPLVPASYTQGSGTQTVTVNVPSDSIQDVPASAYTASDAGTFFPAAVYAIDPTIASCGPSPTPGSTQTFDLNFPTINALSLNDIPDQNPNLATRIPSNLNISGANFLPTIGGGSSTVTYDDGGGVTDSNTAALYVGSTDLRSNLPTNIPPGSQVLNVSVCNQSAGNAYCSQPQQVYIYPLAANPGTLAATPAAPTAGQSTSFAVDFGPPQASAQNGAPNGPVVFTDGSTTLGTAPLVLDSTAQLTQLQSDGNASFFTSTAGAVQSFVADFNQDGVPDTVFLDAVAGTFHFLLGLPPYVGDNPVKPAGVQCSSIPTAAVGDFNKDGIPDIAFICQQGNLALVYTMLGLGDGTTFAVPTLAARGTASFLFASDFNHDGNVDLVTLTTGSSGNGTPQVTFRVYTGDGTGKFQQQDTSGPFAAVPVKLTAADIDGDGATDLVLLASAGGSGPGVYVFHNQLDGNQRYGSFAAPVQPINGSYSDVRVTPLKTSATSTANCVYSCLLPSLIAVDTANSQLLTALNQSSPGTISFFGTLEAVSAPVTTAVAGDFDGDGLVDVAIVGSGGVAVLTGDGAGGFSATAFPSLTDPAAPTNGIAVSAQDENGDGFGDLLVLNRTSNCTTTCTFLSYTYSEVGYVTAGTSHANFTAQAGFAPGAHTITATTPGTYTILGGSVSTSFTVPNTIITPGITLTVTPPSGSPYGTAAMLTSVVTGTTATPTGTIVFEDGNTVIGTITVTGSGSTASASLNAGLLAVGTHNLCAFYSGDANYAPVNAMINYVVVQATPTVNWTPNPSTIAYGTPLTGAQLDATANVAGSFVYTPAAGAVLNAGQQQLSVTFTPSDTTDYKTVTATANILVTQATPSVSWSPSPASIVYGTPLGAGQLDATASVPGTFAYTPAAGTVLNGGLQTLTLVFTPTNTANYAPVNASTTINVTAAPPPISWTPSPATIAYGTPLSAAQLDATSSVPGSFVYTPAAGTVLNAGQQTLSAVFTPTNTTDYQTATVTATITVSQAVPSVSWTPAPASIVYGTPLGAGQLDATASVLGTFAYTPAAGTVLNGGPQTLTAVFTPSNANYQAVNASATITVTPATPSITWAPNPATISYGTPLGAGQLDATSTVAGTFAYTPAAGTVLGAGQQTLSAVFTPSNTQNYQAASATATITVTQGTPMVSWTPNPATIPYGTALSAAQLDATSTVAGTFVYTPAAGAILQAGQQTLTAVFTPSSSNLQATTVTAGITVTQATPTLAWAAPAAIVSGTPLSGTQLDATATGVTGAALSGAFTYTPPAGTILTAGSHQLSALFTPADTVDYTTATVTTPITVIGVGLTSVSPNTALLGDADKTVVVTGTGFLPNSSVQANGTSVTTTYVSPTSLKAVIPASNFLKVGSLNVTVFDPTQGQTTNALPITITAPPASVLVTGPTTTTTDLEPQITFQLVQPYPVEIDGTFVVTFAPANGSPDDPMIRFATPGTNTSDTSGRTFGFVIPANSTVTPPVLLQSGSTAGVITVTLTLNAGGANITPSTVQPLIITAPDAVPGVTSVSLSASGKTLTVVTRGYSNTRELTQANFHFDAAPGHSISTKDLQIDETSLFTQWYASAISAQYGSTFTYTQTFDLDQDATVVGAVQVTLTNSVGVSAVGSSQ